jgi:hypothetical protein
MIWNVKCIRIWKEAVFVYLKVLFQQLAEEAEENNE